MLTFWEGVEVIAMVGVLIWGIEQWYWHWFIWRDMKKWRARHLLSKTTASNPEPPTYPHP